MLQQKKNKPLINYIQLSRYCLKNFDKVIFLFFSNAMLCSHSLNQSLIYLHKKIALIGWFMVQIIMRGFPNTWPWVSRKFPKSLGIWKFLRYRNSCWNLMLVYLKYFRIFANTWVSGKFPKCLSIWEISQRPGYLGKFPTCLGIWEISHMPGYLGNFPHA